jgi:hypothetical protein
VLIAVHRIVVCGATDGADCSTQVYESCPTSAPTKSPITRAPAIKPTLPLVTPAPTTCANIGSCCAYRPCCDECSECVTFPQSRFFEFFERESISICVTKPSCLRSPTASPVTVHLVVCCYEFYIETCCCLHQK